MVGQDVSLVALSFAHLDAGRLFGGVVEQMGDELARRRLDSFSQQVMRRGCCFIFAAPAILCQAVLASFVLWALCCHSNRLFPDSR